MNTSFERSANASDEWYTPREIIEALGEFDLDPWHDMKKAEIPRDRLSTALCTENHIGDRKSVV